MGYVSIWFKAKKQGSHNKDDHNFDNHNKEFSCCQISDFLFSFFIKAIIGTLWEVVFSLVCRMFYLILNLRNIEKKPIILFFASLNLNLETDTYMLPQSNINV